MSPTHSSIRQKEEAPPLPRLVPRAARVPVHVPIKTRPALHDAWTANLSATGLAMTLRSVRQTPQVGAQYEVEFALPGVDQPCALTGRIEWVAPMAHGGGSAVALGMSFVRPPAAQQATLERFVQDHRPSVAALCTTPPQRALCASLSEYAELHLVDTPEELRRLVSGSDISVVVLFCRSAPEVSAALSALEGPKAVGAVELGPPLETRKPRVVCVADLEPLELLALHNQGLVDLSARAAVEATQLTALVRRACDEHDRQSELARFAEEVGRSRRRTSVAAVITPRLAPAPRSAAMGQVQELIAVASGHEVPVLLTGETGTGKEVLSRLLHASSARAGGPFVALDCGALTETLLESELFGHVKGSFTGANEDRPGLFRAADGGTLLLDEIENMPSGLQSRLLRVLETGEVRPVGGTRSYKADARLIAATNRDLWAEVQAGRFRADLYYRLNRFPIRLPSLKERLEDILPLARHFLKELATALKKPVPALSDDAAALLKRYPWPGNLRELRNCLERALLLWDGVRSFSAELIEPMLFGAPIPEAKPEGSLTEQLEAYEREVIRRALANNEGVLRRAAKALGTSPATLGRRAKALGLVPAKSADAP